MNPSDFDAFVKRGIEKNYAGNFRDAAILTRLLIQDFSRQPEL
jgi:hypothetical protein